ncbi:hypothetical protein TRVA0_007S02762 [Trichomonascus vanleenenianus]|uniref:F-box protein n=1 Tax=Trichomonascus vanleenenianus TaxID=2268995 RepID=UPI003ECB794C
MLARKSFVGSHSTPSQTASAYFYDDGSYLASSTDLPEGALANNNNVNLPSPPAPSIDDLAGSVGSSESSHDEEMVNPYLYGTAPAGAAAAPVRPSFFRSQSQFKLFRPSTPQKRTVVKIMQLPMEVLDIIFGYCDAETMGHLQLTCRTMRRVVRPLLWEEVHIDLDPTSGGNRSPWCLVPPEMHHYRTQMNWHMNIHKHNIYYFVASMLRRANPSPKITVSNYNDNVNYLMTWTRNLVVKSPVYDRHDECYDSVDKFDHPHDEYNTLRRINTPQEARELRALCVWLINTLPEHIGALDALDIWGLTASWYNEFEPMLEKFQSTHKGLHWADASATSASLTVNNLISLTLHDTVLPELYHAFTLEEFNFYSNAPISRELLKNALCYCSQLARVTIHIPQFAKGEEASKQIAWLPAYATDYEQFIDEPFPLDKTDCGEAEKMTDEQQKILTVHGGIKWLRTSMPAGRIIQDVIFPSLQRVSIRRGRKTHVMPQKDIFSRCRTVRQLVLEDVSLTCFAEDQCFAPLVNLESLICRAGIFDSYLGRTAIDAIDAVLPPHLHYLIIRPSREDDLALVTVAVARLVANYESRKQLRVFIDCHDDEMIKPQPENTRWRYAKGSIVRDGFATYLGKNLYEFI